MNKDTQFISVLEVAELLDVSPMTVYRLVHNGEIQAVKIGRSFRIAVDSYEQYLNNQIVQPPQALVDVDA